MTVKTPNPLPARSVGLSEISEEENSNFQRTDSQASRSMSSLPTEYSQSYRTWGGARPRNPTSGWQARNLSNILPHGPEAPPQPVRASRRPPPASWLVRQASSQSQIFPVDPPRSTQQDTVANADANNNPNVSVPPMFLGGRRRTGRWPWQARAQASSIFASETENAPPTRPLSAYHRYPWQDRARTSVIFEVLTGKDNGPKNKFRRTYEWDQRQSKLVTEAVQQKQGDQTVDLKRQQDAAKNASMPWKERALQSVVFRSPEKSKCTRPVNYVWDQRRTRLSMHPDPAAQFSKGSSYKENFVQWQVVQDDKGVKAAGKPCYLDDETSSQQNKQSSMNLDSSGGGGKRHFKLKSVSSNEVIPAHSPESSKTSKSPIKLSPKSSCVRGVGSKTVKGETCLDLVPVGYRFSNPATARSKSPSRRK